jgi:hypothetical protein
LAQSSPTGTTINETTDETSIRGASVIGNVSVEGDKLEDVGREPTIVTLLEAVNRAAVDKTSARETIRTKPLGDVRPRGEVGTDTREGDTSVSKDDVETNEDPEGWKEVETRTNEDSHNRIAIKSRIQDGEFGDLSCRHVEGENVEKYDTSTRHDETHDRTNEGVEEEKESKDTFEDGERIHGRGLGLRPVITMIFPYIEIVMTKKTMMKTAERAPKASPKPRPMKLPLVVAVVAR